jgi:tetratricopeptide (TPR) repeat protein
MWQFTRRWSSLAIVFLALARLPAEEPPATPLQAPTRQELDRREALRLYGEALLQEHDSYLIKAIGTLEKASRLDPESALLLKTLAPLYLAVDRSDEALEACRKALDIDPGDYETWYLYARQLRVQNRTSDAITALQKAASCPGLKERAELRLQVIFDLGVLREHAQRFEEAAAAFGAAAALLENADVLVEQGQLTREELASQTAEAYERLGKVCVRAGHFDQAVSAYRKSQEKDPQRAARLNYNLADVYTGQGHFEEALRCLEEYLKTQPEGTEAYERKIEVLRHLGQANEILPSLRAYAQRDEQNPALKLLLARQLVLAGHEQEAEAIYRKLLAESVSVDAYQGLFALYRRQGPAGAEQVLARLDEAIGGASAQEGNRQPVAPGRPSKQVSAARARAMLVVLREDPELVKALLQVLRQHLERGMTFEDGTIAYLAVLAARARQLDDAEKLYRNLLPVAVGRFKEKETEIYSGLLDVLWQAHKYEAIVEVCRQGLAKAQSTPLLLFHQNLAQALMQLGKPDEAIAEANRSVEIASDKQRLWTRRTRARILAEAGHADEAIAECQGMLNDFHDAEEVLQVHYVLSEVYSRTRNFAKAEVELQTILKEHPEEIRVRNDLGYIWADQGKNLAEAEKLIREAIDLDRKEKRSGARVEAYSDQDSGMYLDSLGWVHFRQGRLDVARGELERAVTLLDAVEEPDIWDHLGDICYRQGDAAQARAAWQKAVDLYAGPARGRRDDRLQDIKNKLNLLGKDKGQR